MANIIDMSLIQAAIGLTAPAFADVQEKVDQSFSLFMDVTLPMREANRESNPLRQSLQRFASSGSAMLGTAAAGGIVDMFKAPAQAPQMSSRFASPQAVQSTFGTPTLYGALGNLQRHQQAAQSQMASNMAPPSNMGGPLNFGSFI